MFTSVCQKYKFVARAKEVPFVSSKRTFTHCEGISGFSVGDMMDAYTKLTQFMSPQPTFFRSPRGEPYLLTSK